MATERLRSRCPEAGFETYECQWCGFFHTGSTKVVSRKILIERKKFVRRKKPKSFRAPCLVCGELIAVDKGGSFAYHMYGDEICHGSRMITERAAHESS